MAKSASTKFLDYAERVSRGVEKRDKRKELRMLHTSFESIRSKVGDDELVIDWWLRNVPLLTFHGVE